MFAQLAQFCKHRQRAIQLIGMKIIQLAKLNTAVGLLQVQLWRAGRQHLIEIIDINPLYVPFGQRLVGGAIAPEITEQQNAHRLILRAADSGCGRKIKLKIQTARHDELLGGFDPL